RGPSRGAAPDTRHAARILLRGGRGRRAHARGVKPPKIPVSTLVVIHTSDLQVLLLERADRPGFWQSVTGSQEPGEALAATAAREVREETGLEPADYSLSDWKLENVYEIYPVWRTRYGPGVTHNTEHVFGLELPAPVEVKLSPREHLAAA